MSRVAEQTPSQLRGTPSPTPPWSRRDSVTRCAPHGLLCAAKLRDERALRLFSPTLRSHTFYFLSLILAFGCCRRGCPPSPNWGGGSASGRHRVDVPEWTPGRRRASPRDVSCVGTLVPRAALGELLGYKTRRVEARTRAGRTSAVVKADKPMKTHFREN